MVPATIMASRLLQESLQCSDLCREVSVQGFGLTEKIKLSMKCCMGQNPGYIFVSTPDANYVKQIINMFS